jgi:3-hydroxyacyl-[acyl-carrier-protein] dehydratase
MKEIETLIPQRAPFLFVDKLLSVSKEEIIGASIFSDSNQFLRGSFPDYYFVPGAILIEAMAQCGGAGIRKMGLAEGLFGFAKIENAKFFKGVEYERTFKMVIKNNKITDRYINQSGVGFVDGKPCLDLTWTCIQFGEAPTTPSMHP